MKFPTILALALVCSSYWTSGLHAQGSNSGESDEYYVDDTSVNQGYDYTVKVLWVDRFGKKQRSKGKVLLAHDNGIIIREVTSSRYSSQQSIPSRSIIKLKYRLGRGPTPDVLTGAMDGLFSGGPVQISTGNPYIDVLSGAVQGALFGLINSPRDQRVVWVNQDSRIYQAEVLPELGFTSTSGSGLKD